MTVSRRTILKSMAAMLVMPMPPHETRRQVATAKPPPPLRCRIVFETVEDVPREGGAAMARVIHMLSGAELVKIGDVVAVDFPPVLNVFKKCQGIAEADKGKFVAATWQVVPAWTTIHDWQGLPRSGQ